MTALLGIEDLHAGYGAGDIVQGVDLELRQGEVVALLGRNGVGKTTLLHAIMGVVRPRAGSVRLREHDLAGRRSHEIARAGVALVPQGRRIFSRLTVEENLRLARSASDSRTRWTLDAVYELLPRLQERRRHRGDQLSGGEQQMLAIGRALLGNPTVFLFDEPSEGLAPRIVETMTETIAGLREQGLSAILVEQNLHVALALADAVAIMAKGEIVYRATTAEFRRSPEVARTQLGIGSQSGGPG
jgi:branched-chain amino acid transport system ATP-binding protein